MLRSRRNKKIMFYLLLVGITAVIVTSSVGFMSYRFFNAKLLKERTLYENKLAEKSQQLALYEVKSHQGFVLKNKKKAGETINEEDIVSLKLPDYFTPIDLIDTRENIVGKVIKINADTNTAITNEMVYANGPLDPSLRREEVEYIKLPLELKNKDTVDIRIVYPNGEDYIVVSKKKLDVVNQEKQLAFFNSVEEEALLLQSALVDAYINNAELYMKKYIEPEMQPEPIVTYTPNKDVITVLKTNPQILNQAKWKLSLKIREGLEDRLKLIEDKDRIRVGADAPSGSAVSKRKGNDGAVPANQSNPNGTATGVEGTVNNNNPQVIQPEGSSTSTKEPTSSIDSSSIHSTDNDDTGVTSNSTTDNSVNTEDQNSSLLGR
ncbi:hypothetical protein [Paenibacillus guangzhouensis]|uniref:hypothetical protein n=1 Tax=Paenibacillus guangzhouensis TaxID=1473112 RepID=UPI00187B5E09|nr:hypothetical protein [Paenibacillus guangzhouensis]